MLIKALVFVGIPLLFLYVALLPSQTFDSPAYEDEDE